MLDMIGVGPFITLPLMLSAMGGPQAMVGWIFGALLALCDGLVWAELGAAMPAAGGTYHFLRMIFPGRVGRYLAFLFIFQLCISAPLSIASGSVGLSQYATFIVPSLSSHTLSRTLHLGLYNAGVQVGPTTVLAIAAIALAAAMLYRRARTIRVLTYLMWFAVMATIVWILITGVTHANWHQAFAVTPGAFVLNHGFFLGLGSAMLIATYDLWGYYNITFLGAEVRDPARTVPRAILISIVLVAAIYLAINICVLAVLPAHVLLDATNLDARRAIISLFMQTAYGPVLGPVLGKIAAALIMITAFAGIFSLLLGYSRIPYAAARDGQFFRVFGRLHPTRHIPHVSLLALAATACVFSLLNLADLIAALVVIRILVQFLTQHVGVLYLRRTQPHLRRPFRMWLYPLPPLAALAGFTYVLLSRPNFQRELFLAAILIASGTAVFFLRPGKKLIQADPANV